jgi:hypothetical protein
MGLELQSFANMVAHMVHEEEILGDHQKILEPNVTVIDL